MKRKTLSVFLCLALVGALFAGFGATMAEAETVSVSTETVSEDEAVNYSNPTRHTCFSGFHQAMNNQSWTALCAIPANNTLGVTDGRTYYYLTENISLSTVITIKGTVYLCLNGHTIDGQDKTNLFTVTGSASLYLYDCKKTGALLNGHVVGSGGAIFFASGNNLYLEGVTIRNCIAAGSKGGGIYASSGNVELKNCIIQHCRCISGGGGIGNDGACLTLTDSTIRDCETNTFGGGIYQNCSQDLFLNGLINIYGNHYIYVVKVSNISLGRGAALSIGTNGLDENSLIGVEVEGEGEFCKNAFCDYSHCFLTDKGSFRVAYSDNALSAVYESSYSTASLESGWQKLVLNDNVCYYVYLNRIGNTYTIQLAPNGQYLAVEHEDYGDDSFDKIVLSDTSVAWYTDLSDAGEGLYSYAVNDLTSQSKVYLTYDRSFGFDATSDSVTAAAFNFN